MDLPAVPTGIPPQVLYRVQTMLASGFHPSAIVDQLERTEGIKVALTDVVACSATVTKPDLPSLKDPFNGQDVVSDPLAESHRALILLGSRIAQRLEVERTDKEGKLDSRIDAMLLNLIKLSNETASLMDQLGVNPWAKKAPSNEQRSLTATFTLREMLTNPANPPVDGEFTEL